MLNSVGSGQAAKLGADTNWWRSQSPYRFNGGRCISSCPFGVDHHQGCHLKDLAPLRQFSAPRVAARLWVSFKGSASADAAGANVADSPPQDIGTRQHQHQQQWSSSWSSTNSGFRGAYGEWAGEEASNVIGETGQPNGSELRSRAGKLLALGSAVGLELLLTGSLVWTPLAAAAVAFLVLPGARALTAAQAAAREAEAVARAEARVRAEMAARVPVSPPESAAWLGRMMGELWEPFVQPLVLGENLGHWADKVRRAAPAGLELQLEEMSLGKQAPRMSNFQVLADPSSGRVTAIDCDMAFDSSSMRVVVSGSGPLGRFKSTMMGINMRGRMRLLPIPEQRILLFSFREPPQIDPKLTLEGPFLGARDIPPTSLLRSLLAATLQDCLVEPVRGAISLDPEPRVGQPIDALVNIYIESVQGVTAEGGPGTAPAAAGPAAGPTPQQQQTASSPPPPHSSSLPPSTSGHLQQHSGSPLLPYQDDTAAAAFFNSLAAPDTSQQSVLPSAPQGSGGGSSNGGGTGGGGGGGSATAAVVAAASSAAAAAGEAVVEGAGAIASLVPGLSAVAGGGGGAEGGGRTSRQRMLQVIAINTDNKLQRETKPVPYTPVKPSAGGGGIPGGVVPVLQMLQLNVGHKDTIYKLLVKDLGRSGLVGNVAGGPAAATAGGTGAGSSTTLPPSAASSFPSSSSSSSSPVSASSGPTSAASSTPSSVAAAVVSGLPTPGLLGSVRLHVAAAKDGCTLFWAAGVGGEPVAIRWRPSDGPWRVTLPLESPTSGLPPPPPPLTAPAVAAVPVPTTGGREGTLAAQAILGSSPGASSGNNGGGKRGSGDSSSSSGREVDIASDAAATSQPAGATAGAPPVRGDASASAVQQAEAEAAPAVYGSATVEAAGKAHHHATAAAADAGKPRSASSPGTGAAAAAAAAAGGPSISLLISAEPWAYKETKLPYGSPFESPRPRSFVLQIVEARDLAAHDWAGTCDPYVRISYDDRAYRTRTLYNAHTPVWQQTFILPDNRSPTSPIIPPRNRLLLSVYDSGVSRDDRLGITSLNLDMASEHQLQDRWIPLQGVESGWLRVRLAAIPDSPDSASVRRTVEALEGLTRGSAPLLQVVVLSVRALSPRRGAQLLGLRDAYCNITYDGARHVTPVVRQDQNPRWDHSALFVMRNDDAEGQQQTGVEGHQLLTVPGPARQQGEEQREQMNKAAGIARAAGSVSPGFLERFAAGGSSSYSGRKPGGGPGSVHVAETSSHVGGPSATHGNVPTDSRQQERSSGTANGHSNKSAVVSGSGGNTDDEPAAGASVASLPPYPRPMSAGAASVSMTTPQTPPLPSAVIATAPRSPRPRPRFRRDLNRDILRLEVKDVAPVPPDEDLGWVELPVRALLPQPGDSWQGWLPLRRGEGAELLVRISRIEPLPLGQAGLPVPQQLQQQEWPGGRVGAGAAGSPAAQPPASGTAPAGSSGGSSSGGPGGEAGRFEAGSGGAGPGAGSSPAQGVALMERVTLDSFTDQVRAANRAASYVGQDLRVRLGQDVIPKLQDWWEGTLQHAATSLEKPSAQLSSWLQNPQLVPAAWMEGISAMHGKRQSHGLQQQQQKLLLPSPSSSMPRSPEPVQGRQVKEAKDGADIARQQEQQLSSGSSISISESGGTVDGLLAGERRQLKGPALETEGGNKAHSSNNTPVLATADDTAEGNSSSANGSSIKGGRVSGKTVKGGVGRKNGVAKGSRSKSTEGGGLGQLLARSWEQLLGPPAYQPKVNVSERPGPQEEQQPPAP